MSGTSDLRWKPKDKIDGGKASDCWLTECGYTVARCYIGTEPVYQVTAPRESKPLAHPKSREEVVKVINMDKELRNDRD